MNHAPEDITVSHLLGELVWLMSQAPAYADLSLTRVVGYVLAPIIAKQVVIFREEMKPIGAVLWAKVGSEIDERMAASGIANSHLNPEDWCSGNTLWITDMIFPFDSPKNNHLNTAFADLVTGRFKGKSFKMMRLDPSGESEPVEISDTMGEDIVAALKAKIGILT